MTQGNQFGRRTTLGASSGLAQTVRTRLADDPAWNHVSRNGAWVCPYCLSSVRGSDTTKAALGRSIENHLSRRCTGWNNGRGEAKPDQQIASRLAHEEIAHLAASDPAWQVFDHEGYWYSPCSLQKVHAVRLSGGRFDSFTVQNMVTHLSGCDQYRSGVVHPAADVQRARDVAIRAGQLIPNIRQLLQYPLWRYANTSHHWTCPFCIHPVQSVPMISPVDWELAPDRMSWHLAAECHAYVPEQPQPQSEGTVRAASGGGEPRTRPTSHAGGESSRSSLRIARSGSHGATGSNRNSRSPVSTRMDPGTSGTDSDAGGSRRATDIQRTPLPDVSTDPRIANAVNNSPMPGAARIATPITGLGLNGNQPMPGTARIATPLPGAVRTAPPATNKPPTSVRIARPTSPPKPANGGADLFSGTIFDEFDTDAHQHQPTSAETSADVKPGDESGDHPHFSWMDDVEEKSQHTKTARVESDRVKARDVQVGMLGKLPEIPGYTFAARFEACEEVSGDFYDFITLPDGRIGIAQGDVSGHGLHAGLIMSMAKKTLSIYAALGGGPAETLAKVNDSLVDDLGGRIFISMTYAILDPDVRRITWARAGHNPTMHYNRLTDEIDEIMPKGMVVGMKKGAIFSNALEEHTTQAKAGDLFLVYTDGINETMNRRNEEFGTELLIEVVRKHSEHGPEILLDRIMDSIRQFRGGSTASDDSTILAFTID